MTRRSSHLLLLGLGVWAGGALVGANAAELLPLEASWPAGVLLAIGVVVSLGNLLALRRAESPPE